MSQPQLLQIALDPQDIVFTPDWVAQDMVSFFQPSGVILDPCKGDGVFLKYLPPAEWCEIREGKDFYAWHKPVDWVFGNPPYSQFSKWLDHSMSIAQNICYFIPLTRLFNSGFFIKRTMKWGGIAHMRYYADGGELGWNIGFAIGAVHFKKDYSGPMYQSQAAMPSNTRSHPTAGTRRAKKHLSTPKGQSTLEGFTKPTSGG